MAASPELDQQYRKALKLYVGLLLLFTPVVFVLAWIALKLFGTLLPGFVFAAIWASAWVATTVWAVVLRARIRNSS